MLMLSKAQRWTIATVILAILGYGLGAMAGVWPTPTGTGYGYTIGGVPQSVSLAGDAGLCAGFCDGGIPCSLPCGSGGASALLQLDGGGCNGGLIGDSGPAGLYCTQSPGYTGTVSAPNGGFQNEYSSKIDIDAGANAHDTTSEISFRIDNNSAWVTAWPQTGTFTPSTTTEQDDCIAVIGLHDYSGLSDGGLNADAGGGQPIGNAAPNGASLKTAWHVQQLGLQPDGGAGPLLEVGALGGAPFGQTSVASLPLVVEYDCHGCTTVATTTGCACGTSVPEYSAQILVTDGGVVFQIAGYSDAGALASFPQFGTAAVRCDRRLAGGL